VNVRDRRSHLAAAQVLQALGDRRDRVASIVVDGQSIDPAKALQVAAEAPSGEIKLPRFVNRLLDKTSGHPAGQTPAAPTHKPSLVHRVWESKPVQKAVELVQRDAATVVHHAQVEVKLVDGTSDHFAVAVDDVRASRWLRPVLLAADAIVAAPLPPGATSLLLAPVAVLSGVASVLFGLKGDADVKNALRRMTLKELALIPIGEIDQTGVLGVTALAADLAAARHPSHEQAVSVEQLGHLKQWAAAAPA
jgi:hypothetical protein